MSVNREIKEKLVLEISSTFQQNDTFYLLDYVKIPVLKSMQLRRQLRENGCALKVIKNRLALRALKDEFPEELSQHFQGPTAIAYTAENPVGLARLLKEFSTKNRILKVKAGLVEGKYLPEDRFAEIANLTSRDDLVAKLGFLMAFPLIQLLRTWQAPINSFGSLLNQLKSKK